MLRPTTDLARAIEAVQRGGLVAIPTETVYGLAADATDAGAVRRIFEVKGRPPGHPLIVHLAHLEQVDEWALDVPAAARRLLTAAWPGPLTVILARSGRVIDDVTGGRRTVGLRMPAHPLTLDLIAATGPLAAPSANRFGAVSPTTAAHVVDDLGERLDPATDVVLDGGPSPIGVESTIVDFCSGPPQVLRAGGIPPEQVERLLGGDVAEATGPARASGMLASHYAPAASVLLVDDRASAERAVALTPGAVILDMTDDVVRYARDLYAFLRDADAAGVGQVVAVMPPPIGLGHAIRDRLTKAAAPR